MSADSALEADVVRLMATALDDCRTLDRQSDIAESMALLGTRLVIATLQFGQAVVLNFKAATTHKDQYLCYIKEENY